MYHSFSIEEIFSHFQTSGKGLTTEEVTSRRQKYGENRLEEEEISIWKLLIRQFNNILIYILFAASLVSILIGEWGDFLIINIIIFFNAIIGFWQEKKAQSAIEALKKMTEHRTKVLRDGEMLLLPSREIVPGDFVVFHEGEVITADVRITESSSLMVDESTLTGESTPVTKDEKRVLDKNTLPFDRINILFTGSAVVRGMAKGVVVHTGKDSYLAQIAKKSIKKKPKTPLTKALDHFSQKYLIVLILLFLSMGIVGFFQGRPLVELGYVLLAALVSAVPEGLPLVITLVMVLGALKLSKKKTLVRFLPSVETLGSTTVIASDKTGTITEGSLIVKDIFTVDEKKLDEVAVLCNDAEEGRGDPLDLALIDYIEHFAAIRKDSPRKWSYPFDPKKMLMATINETNGKETLYVKGAYESLKKMAESSSQLDLFEKKLDEMVEKGLRVLAFGYSDTPQKEPEQWKISLVGLIGFLDPPKEGVMEAIALAKEAGIKVIMITGDHPRTAKEIARQVGIWQEDDGIVTGHEIEKIAEEKLGDLLEKSTVMARILPEHKYSIVEHLKQKKEIVAVTGDGVNDVPALRSANLGIAMGNGTDAAKAASEMVITDNNLSVIVDAVRYGRVIADNIRKIIYYLLSTSLQEIFIIGSSLMAGLAVPLNAVQILWINIVTDGTQDKTFPFAKEEEDVMKRKPRNPKKQFFDLRQIVHLSIFGCGMGLFVFALYLYLLPLYPYSIVSTLIFTSVVTAQWANAIQAQKQKDPFFYHIKKSVTINPLIFIGIAASFILQCFAIYLFPALFHAIPITLSMWRYPLISFIASFFLVELRKWIEFFYDHRWKKC